jgi:hypothetical protein
VNLVRITRLRAVAINAFVGSGNRMFIGAGAAPRAAATGHATDSDKREEC